MPKVKTLLDPLTRGKVPHRKKNISGRYEKAWVYKDDNNRYFLGTFPSINIPPDPTDQLYIIQAGDDARPDILSYKFYKTPALFWVILRVNDILDPFEKMYVGMLIRIPTIQRLASLGINA